MGRYERFKKNGQENTSQGSTVPKDQPHGLLKPDHNSNVLYDAWTGGERFLRNMERSKK